MQIKINSPLVDSDIGLVKPPTHAIRERGQAFSLSLSEPSIPKPASFLYVLGRKRCILTVDSKMLGRSSFVIIQAPPREEILSDHQPEQSGECPSPSPSIDISFSLLEYLRNHCCCSCPPASCINLCSWKKHELPMPGSTMGMMSLYAHTRYSRA